MNEIETVWLRVLAVLVGLAAVPAFFGVWEPLVGALLCSALIAVLGVVVRVMDRHAAP